MLLNSENYAHEPRPRQPPGSVAAQPKATFVPTAIRFSPVLVPIPSLLDLKFVLAKFINSTSTTEWSSDFLPFLNLFLAFRNKPGIIFQAASFRSKLQLMHLKACLRGQAFPTYPPGAAGMSAHPLCGAANAVVSLVICRVQVQP